jgi:putative flippase GtrA
LTILRYLLVQILAYGVDVGTFIALISTGVAGPLLANLAAKIPAGIFAFLAHRRFTFRIHDFERAHREAIRYFVLLALNAPMSTLILKGLLTFNAPVTLAKILADVLAVGVSYTLTKYVVFGRGRPTRRGTAEGPLPREKH